MFVVSVSQHPHLWGETNILAYDSSHRIAHLYDQVRQKQTCRLKVCNLLLWENNRSLFILEVIQFWGKKVKV